MHREWRWENLPPSRPPGGDTEQEADEGDSSQLKHKGPDTGPDQNTQLL